MRSASGEAGDLRSLLDEQIAYYRARSREYDEWFLREGRYDRGAERNALWFEEVELVRARLGALQSALPRSAAVLELACGTGIWTERLAGRAASVRAVDASPEVIELNQARLEAAGLLSRVDYEVADLFSWRPTRRYALVFFGFWLSHVPPSRFEDFWALVADCLEPGGRFFLLDNLPSRYSGHESQKLPDPGSTRVSRELKDGRQFDIVKVFYEPSELTARLAALGFEADVDATPNFFLVAAGSRP